MKEFLKNNKNTIKGSTFLLISVGLIFWELIDVENEKIISTLDVAVLGICFICSIILTFYGIKADALKK